MPVAFFLAFALWYRNHHTDHLVPKWNVVDFQIKDYRMQEEAYLNHANDFRDRERLHRKVHNYQDQVEDIGSRPAFQQQQLSYDELQDKIQQFIQWDRPHTDHWPAWHDYDNADYDPNRWEAMDR